MIEEIQYGSRTIRFTLESRKRKTLGISVNPDSSVEVTAPLSRSRDEVLAAVQRRARWIVKQQDRFALLDRRESRREYVSGETHGYLGRQYLLKVIPVESKGAEQVKLIGPHLQVFSSQPANSERVKMQLERWYRERARVKFAERLDRCLEHVRKYGIVGPDLKIVKMLRRWGSCTKSGSILLNLHLIQAPTHCIDYVITHELCHLKIMKHDRAFIELLTAIMPDWQLRKERLEQF